MTTSFVINDNTNNRISKTQNSYQNLVIIRINIKYKSSFVIPAMTSQKRNSSRWWTSKIHRQNTSGTELLGVEASVEHKPTYFAVRVGTINYPRTSPYGFNHCFQLQYNCGNLLPPNAIILQLYNEDSLICIHTRDNRDPAASLFNDISKGKFPLSRTWRTFRVIINANMNNNIDATT